MLDGRAQLAHVARPAILPQQVEGRAAQAHLAALVFGAELADEGVGHQDDVAGALAQGRQVQGDDVESLVEVQAEASLAHHLLEVAVRRGDDAHVDGDRLVATHALNAALAEHTQQLYLSRDVNLADFVEKDRAAARLLKAPDATLRRPGEGAFFMPEELALHQLGGEGRAVYGDELLLSAPREAVDGASDELLARAAFTFDEHGGRGRGHAADAVEDDLHLRAVAEHGIQPLRRVQLRLELAVLRLEVARVRRALEQQLHLIEVERLGDKVVGAVAARFGSRVLAAVGRHHDAGRRRRQRLGVVDEVHAALAAEPQIRQHQVDRLAVEHGAGGLAVGGGVDLVVIPQRLTEHVAGCLLIIDNEQNRQNHFLSGGGGVGHHQRNRPSGRQGQAAGGAFRRPRA